MLRGALEEPCSPWVRHSLRRETSVVLLLARTGGLSPARLHLYAGATRVPAAPGPERSDPASGDRQALTDELILFPQAEHDDLFDALQTIVEGAMSWDGPDWGMVFGP
ncbi:MAG: hypothetical protein DHS20C21_05680 [Gemmatimonadota bacterium]|nr:MAG: hypothetical protein DHS20C21_05680 [Gemmatimonadota bacterium]